MKKFPSILFVFSLLFMLTACSSSADPSQESSGQTTSPSSQQDSVSVSNAVLESESTESEQSANNTLIVYFSRWGNTEYPSDVDATTSASIVVDNNFRYGTTEYVANMIAENVGGDLHRIETVTPYTADFDELRDVNHDEMSSNYLPELKESNLDISAYDTVFIGYFYAVFGVQWNCIVPSHFCGITHSRTDGNSENHAPGGILLGICADEYSFRISLEHGSWTVPQTL